MPSKKSVTMTRRAFVKEHQELVDTLKNPTPKKLAKEAQEQSSELKRIQTKKK